MWLDGYDGTAFAVTNNNQDSGQVLGESLLIS